MPERMDIQWWGRFGANNGSLDGSVNGGTTFTTGFVAQAFSFDGVDDRVTVPDSAGLSPTSAITIDAWIKPTLTTQQMVFVSKFDNSLATGRSYYLSTDTSGSKLQFTVYQSGTAASLVRRTETSGSVLTANVFTHIAATFDTSTQAMKIYVNGVDTATQRAPRPSRLSMLYSPIWSRRQELIRRSGRD